MMDTNRHDTTGGPNYARTFARIFGPVLLLVGIVGLLLGDKLLLDVLNIDVVEDLIHVVSGILLIFLGFKAGDGMAKTGVMVLGVVYLIVTVLGFVAPDFIEAINPHGYTIVDNLIHLSTGVLAVAAAMMSKVGRV